MTTALTMSNPLSTLDLSELPEPYVRAVPASAPAPPSPPPQQLDLWWGPSSHPNQQPHPSEPLQTPQTPSSSPNQLFSSFIHPHSQPSPNPRVPLSQLPSPLSVPNHSRTPPALSHTFPQNARMIYTIPLRATAPPQTAPPHPAPPHPAPPHPAPPHPAPQSPAPQSPAPQSPAPRQTAPLASPVIAPMFPSPSDGLSAVERAKKSADQFTMSQLAKKRKAAGLDPDPKRSRNMSPSKSSTEDDDKNDEHLPEKISHRKYQKRLQKNRDSAFVSRIRRREYTRLLEESLATTEKEKEVAVNSFIEMKRRFDIVSAELNAFKQAAASNLSAVRESLFSHLTTTTTDTQPVRSGTVVKSMFMFSLLFGAFSPDCVKQRFGSQRYSPGSSHLPSHKALSGAGSAKYTGIRSMLFGNRFSQDSHNVNESRGKVWGQDASTMYLEEELDGMDKSCHEAALNAIRSGTLDVLGAEYSERFLKLAQPYLEGLPQEQIARLGDVLKQGNSTSFEQLVEIEALVRKVERQLPSDSDSLLEHITLQMENARL